MRATSDIAAAENISPEYITHNIDVGLLSPLILQKAIDGGLPPNISAKALTRMNIPSGWTDQEALLLR